MVSRGSRNVFDRARAAPTKQSRVVGGGFDEIRSTGRVTSGVKPWRSARQAAPMVTDGVMLAGDCRIHPLPVTRHLLLMPQWTARLNSVR